METGGILLLFLLLPVAAFTGWYLARRKQDRDDFYQSKNIPTEYLKGLNYVLNEEPDKAIELFIKMLEVDSDTIETHLALGNLFRRRGEVDRAIRIHQNLIARPTLSKEQHTLALLELAMDYMRLGLLDRAENLFNELLESGLYMVQAFTGLLDIYQQEKDWEKAISNARRLEMISSENNSSNIAQFYCELADKNLRADNEKEARYYLKRALNTDPKCTRASLMEGQLLQKQGKTKIAIRAFKRVLKQDPDFLSETIAPMMGCYREMGKLNDFMQYLRELVDTYGGITPLLHLTMLIEELQGEEEAVKYISSELKLRPTVRGVDKLIEYAITRADGVIRDNLVTIKEMTEKLLESNPVYKCIQCGYDVRNMHWHCPSCKQWSTIKPVHGVEGE